MSTMFIIYSILLVLVTLAVSVFVATVLPGFERKYIHARIQQRVGPNVFSPGLLSIFKFSFKKETSTNSPSPKLYNSLPFICFIVIMLVILTLIPQNYVFLGFASIIAIIGFLKVEEITYVLMGSLSKSVLSGNMPFPDKVAGAKRLDTNVSFMEDISSNRSLRLIALGSFPFYLAILIPVVITRSIYLGDIVNFQHINGPILFSIPGVIGAIVFLIGYIILLNEYPFSILKAKSDVIEGPYLEYSGNRRAFVYLNKGLLMFALSSLFAVLFLGIPLSLMSWGIIIVLFLAFLFPVLAGILGAFSPVFTFRQFYPVVFVTSILGVLGIVLSLFI